MVVQYAEGRARSFENHIAADKSYLRNPETGEYLHLSGHGTTRNPVWAWIGFARQIETLRARAKIRGEPFPFEPVPRHLAEDTTQPPHRPEGSSDG